MMVLALLVVALVLVAGLVAGLVALMRGPRERDLGLVWEYERQPKRYWTRNGRQ